MMVCCWQASLFMICFILVEKPQTDSKASTIFNKASPAPSQEHSGHVPLRCGTASAPRIWEWAMVPRRVGKIWNTPGHFCTWSWYFIDCVFCWTFLTNNSGQLTVARYPILLWINWFPRNQISVFMSDMFKPVTWTHGNLCRVYTWSSK